MSVRPSRELGPDTLPPVTVERLAVIAAHGGWERLRFALSRDQRKTPLSVFPFHSRVREYIAVHRLDTLGELADRCLEWPANLSVPVLAYFKDPAGTEAALAPTLLEGFRAWVLALDARRRAILDARSGLAGPVKGYAEIGRDLGISHSRATRLSKELGGRLRRDIWGQRATYEVRKALEGGAARLAALRDPFWSNVAENAREAGLAADLLDPPVHVVTVKGEPWLARDTRDDDTEWSALHIVRSPLSRVLDAHAPLDAQSELLYFLARAPLPIAIENAPPLASLPADVVIFGPGVLGLERHFPRYRELAEEVAPAVRAIITARGRDRHWPVDILLEELRETRDLPAALTPHVLWSMLRNRKDFACTQALEVALRQ